LSAYIDIIGLQVYVHISYGTVIVFTD